MRLIDADALLEQYNQRYAIEIVKGSVVNE